jgi:hypothetical protein
MTVTASMKAKTLIPIAAFAAAVVAGWVYDIKAWSERIKSVEALIAIKVLLSI